MKYVVVYENAPRNYAAYVPDLPGCITTGDTREELEQLMRGAIELHIEALREQGQPVPAPGTWTGLVEVHAAERQEDDLRRDRALGG